jgi:hypothetical protein
MSVAELKKKIAGMTVEERREIAAMIEQLNRADNLESEQRPEGYFTDDYKNRDEERIQFENSYAESLIQRPER